MKSPVQLPRGYVVLGLVLLTVLLCMYGHWWFVGVFVWLLFNLKRLQQK